MNLRIYKVLINFLSHYLLQQELQIIFNIAGTIEIDPLIQSMKEYMELQRSQTEEFTRKFPLDDRLLQSLKSCKNQQSSVLKNDSVYTLLPSMVEIYAEIGSLFTFCDSTSMLLSDEININGAMDLTAIIESIIGIIWF